MRIANFAVAAGVFALGLAMWTMPSIAQGPLYDRVQVTLPYTVTIGDKTLQPGDYVIQQLRTDDPSNRTLLIYSDNGMKFETSAITIPALDNNSAPDTKVVLHHFGPDYYFDKVWIQGKNYGYEFPMPDSVKARQRERMEPISVAAQYQAVPEPQQTASAQTTTENNNAIASSNADREETNTDRNSSMMAQNNTPAPEPAQPAPAPAPAPQTTTENNANTNTNATTTTGNANREMPATALNWLGMLLSGGTLSGAGLLLRRRR